MGEIVFLMLAVRENRHCRSSGLGRRPGALPTPAGCKPTEAFIGARPRRRLRATIVPHSQGGLRFHREIPQAWRNAWDRRIVRMSWPSHAARGAGGEQTDAAGAAHRQEVRMWVQPSANGSKAQTSGIELRAYVQTLSLIRASPENCKPWERHKE